MSSLGEWCHANGDICPACGSEKITFSHIVAYVQCGYCNLRISEEIMYREVHADIIANMLYEFKSQWGRRVQIIRETSTEVLYDELVTRGILQPKPPIPSPSITQLMKDIYAPIIESQMSKADYFNKILEEANKVKPKPWSYEEAAASEFNLDEGTGLE